MRPDARDPDEETLEGILGRVLFSNDDASFAVALLKLEGARESMRVAGALGGLHEGERVRLTGRRSVHPKFGDQFKVHAAFPLLPHSLEGIEAYLSSGRV